MFPLHKGIDSLVPTKDLSGEIPCGAAGCFPYIKVLVALAGRRVFFPYKCRGWGKVYTCGSPCCNCNER